MIGLVLEDERAEVQSIPLSKNEIIGGCTMPLCGIVPPPSKELRCSYAIMFSPLAHVHSHEPR